MANGPWSTKRVSVPDVTPTPDDVANHWSSWSNWDDPDIEVQMHVDGHYGAFRHVRKSTGEVVSFGQICYTAEHFQKLKVNQEESPDAQGP